MTDGVGDPLVEADGELALARLALDDGDAQHAAQHLAGVLAHAPTLPEAHELLARLAAGRPDGGADLFPVDTDKIFIGTVVARAHALARHNPSDALRLLAEATAHDPAQPWADVPWIRAVDLSTVAPGVLADVFRKIMMRLGDPPSAQVRAASGVYLVLARSAVAAYPDHALVHGTAAGIARRLGTPAQAVAWGARGYQLSRSKVTATWYAYALRADGRLDQALAVMREALVDNPLDLDLAADVASWLAAAGRLDEAIGTLEEAMRVDPTYECAVHTLHRLRYRRDGQVRHLIELSDFVRTFVAPARHAHEHTDLTDCCAGQAWLGVVAPPTEVSVGMLGRLPAGTVGMQQAALTSLEPPSALALLVRRFPEVNLMTLHTSPDQVAPLRPGQLLWRYDGPRAVPVPDPPSAAASALLAGIATLIWDHPVAAYDLGLPLGELPLHELLALLVRPPAAPDAWARAPVGCWERAAQVFACLGILHCRELAPAAGTGAAREVLTDIAFGIEDWTTEAALFALVVAAWVEPGCRHEVAATVAARFQAAAGAAQNRPVSILPSLAQLTVITPEIDPAALTAALAIRQGKRHRPGGSWLRRLRRRR